MNTTKTILKYAKDILVESGWCQGVFRNLNGRVCLLGALRLSVNGDGTTPLRDQRGTDAFRKAVDVVADTLGNGGISCWNDDPERTVEEVVSLLDKAIEKCPNE